MDLELNSVIVINYKEDSRLEEWAIGSSHSSSSSWHMLGWLQIGFPTDNTMVFFPEFHSWGLVIPFLWSREQIAHLESSWMPRSFCSKGCGPGGPTLISSSRVAGSKYFFQSTYLQWSWKHSWFSPQAGHFCIWNARHDFSQSLAGVVSHSDPGQCMHRHANAMKTTLSYS